MFVLAHVKETQGTNNKKWYALPTYYQMEKNHQRPEMKSVFSDISCNQCLLTESLMYSVSKTACISKRDQDAPLAMAGTLSL